MLTWDFTNSGTDEMSSGRLAAYLAVAPLIFAVQS